MRTMTVAMAQMNSERLTADCPREYERFRDHGEQQNITSRDLSALHDIIRGIVAQYRKIFKFSAQLSI